MVSKADSSLNGCIDGLMRKRVDHILEDIYGENAYRRVSDSAKKDAFQRKEVTGLKQLKLYSWSTVLDANERYCQKLCMSGRRIRNG
jgi:hypothetical protein